MLSCLDMLAGNSLYLNSFPAFFTLPEIAFIIDKTPQLGLAPGKPYRFAGTLEQRSLFFSGPFPDTAEQESAM